MNQIMICTMAIQMREHTTMRYALQPEAWTNKHKKLCIKAYGCIYKKHKNRKLGSRIRIRVLIVQAKLFPCDTCMQSKQVRLHRWSTRAHATLMQYLPQILNCIGSCQLSYLSTNSPERVLITAEMQPALEQYGPIGWTSLRNTSVEENAHTADIISNRIESVKTSHLHVNQIVIYNLN